MKKIFVSPNLLLSFLLLLASCSSPTSRPGEENASGEKEIWLAGITKSDVLKQTDTEIYIPGKMGSEEYELIRADDIAAHVRIHSGAKITFTSTAKEDEQYRHEDLSFVQAAFAAGNSGAMIAFAGLPQLQRLRPSTIFFNGPDRGVVSHVRANKLMMRGHTAVLGIRDSVLGSMHFLRDYVVVGIKPHIIQERTQLQSDGSLLLYRYSLNGEQNLNGGHKASPTTYKIWLQPQQGAKLTKDENGSWQITRENAEQIDFKIILTSSEPLLKAMPVSRIFKPELQNQLDPLGMTKLAYLFYDNEVLAGSHAYLSFFGRDALITAKLLSPILTKEALQVYLRAAMASMNDEGEVAHEQFTGELPAFWRLQSGEGSLAPVTYSHTMVDSSFLFLPLFADYLAGLNLHNTQDISELRSFLLEPSQGGKTQLEMLKRNMEFVLSSTRKFHDNPIWQNLIAFKAGRVNGNWRDSIHGSADGKIVFDVNVALVPAALKALAEISKFPMPELQDEKRQTQASQTEEVWRERAPGFFQVELPADNALRLAGDYAKTLGLKSSTARKGNASKVRFYGISLDEKGSVIPVMNSDMSAVLLYDDPSESILQYGLDSILETFPLGLNSPAGMLVANAAYAPDKQNTFTREAYHATIWPMQMIMMIDGLKRQLARTDLSRKMRKQLLEAQKLAWQNFWPQRDWRDVEFWTYKFTDGVMARQTYGQEVGHQVESNTDQQWNLAYLGVQIPPEIWPILNSGASPTTASGIATPSGASAQGVLQSGRSSLPPGAQPTPAQALIR